MSTQQVLGPQFGLTEECVGTSASRLTKARRMTWFVGDTAPRDFSLALPCPSSLGQMGNDRPQTFPGPAAEVPVGWPSESGPGDSAKAVQHLVSRIASWRWSHATGTPTPLAPSDRNSTGKAAGTQSSPCLRTGRGRRLPGRARPTNAFTSAIGTATPAALSCSAISCSVCLAGSRPWRPDRAGLTVPKRNTEFGCARYRPAVDGAPNFGAGPGPSTVTCRDLCCAGSLRSTGRRSAHSWITLPGRQTHGSHALTLSAVQDELRGSTAMTGLDLPDDRDSRPGHRCRSEHSATGGRGDARHATMPSA